MRLKYILLLAASLIFTQACGSAPAMPDEAPTVEVPNADDAARDAKSDLDDATFVPLEGLANAAVPMSNVMTAGQPTLEQFAQIKAMGVTTVINLRMDGELDWDEGKVVTELGMKYVSIPVAGADGLTQENVQAMYMALAEGAEERVLLHCGSSNRVGALFALGGVWLEGKSAEDSLKFGKEAGLAGLLPNVEALLSAE